MMRVLISGGGIAGLRLANFLHRYGMEPVVIEQAGERRSDGYAIDFFGTGYDVAERMQLIDRLQAEHIPVEAVVYVSQSGKPIARLDIALMRKVMHGKYMALMRLSLEQALYVAIAGSVEVRFCRSLAAVQQSPEAVSATFNDGTTETFDLLIGAEGIHCNTRDLVFGPEERFGRYLGYDVACYALPDRYGIGPNWRNYAEPGRQAGAYCSNNEDEIITLFMFKAQDEGHIPREQRLPRLRQVFAGMDWITPQLLDNVPDPEAIFMDTVTQIQMPTWHLDRVALVGDACGCPTLISRQGASLAMGGASILAEALHAMDSYQDAFRVYESLMKPFVDSRQKNARDARQSVRARQSAGADGTTDRDETGAAGGLHRPAAPAVRRGEPPRGARDAPPIVALRMRGASKN
jgi:2-polyprenyl-6-methoxyphenol hydroxylase-like FAD-dependent oxidoreductase